MHVCCQLKHYNTPSVADSLLDYTLQFDIRERRALHNIEKKVAKHVIFSYKMYIIFECVRITHLASKKATILM